jgi:large repetitive protein
MTLNVLIGNGTWYPIVGTAPVITIPTSLPSGTANTAYTSTQFYASGTEPITWSNTGSLPSGMTFSSSGLLSGTPTNTANSSITFTATNAYGSNNSVLTLTINAAPGPVLITAPSISVWRAA